MQYLTPPERLPDKTVREHWEKARKVNTAGQPVRISPDGPLGDAAWAGHHLPDVRHDRRVPAPASCPAAGHTADHQLPPRPRPARVAEMNRQVAANLAKIITALEADGQDRRRLPCVLTGCPARRGRGPPARADPIQSHSGPARADRSGAPVTFAAVAAAAGISRSWLYTQPDISGQVRKLRNDARDRDPATAIPTAQRATGESLRARLTAALQRNQQLAAENARLRRQLARALGDQRSSRTRSGNDPTETP